MGRKTARTPPKKRPKPVLYALLLAALVLAGTVDERVFGLVTDGQIMTRTAFSILSLGELGMARGHPVNVQRPGGDAVTRYGMGASLVRLLPLALAEAWERAFGVGASQTLFVLENILLILAAAGAAASLARAWGATDKDAARAVLACAVASPLWGYAGSDFSEPLQAALVGGVFAMGTLSRAEDLSRRKGLLLAAGTGLLASGALLSKSIFIVLLPLAVLLVCWGLPKEVRFSRAAAAAAGAVPLGLAWLAFEIVRFGRPLASYVGEHFNHPVPDGLWRLVVGPNKGLLLYFPLALLVWPGLKRAFSRDLYAVLLAGGFTLFLLLSTAAWWSWDGTAGWGPRLLVPLIPLLSALAAIGAASLPPLLFRVLLGAGVAVNALGALQPDSATSWYYFVLPNRPLPAAEVPRWPSFAMATNSRTGGFELLALHEVAKKPALSPIRLSAWLLEKRLEGGDMLRALRTPPWRTDVPGQEMAFPPQEAIPATALVFLTTPFRWPHLGMSLFRERGQVDTALAYLDCLFDQALRAQDMRRGDRAVRFGEKLYDVLPGPQTAVQLAEGLRLAGRREALADFVASVPRSHKSDPEFGMVMALADRDAGNERQAREILEAVLKAAPRPAFLKLRDEPLSAWPPTLRDLTRPA